MPWTYVSDRTKALADEAKAIAQRAMNAGRDITPEESAKCQDLLERMKKSRVQDQREQAKKDEKNLTDQIKQFGADIGIGDYKETPHYKNGLTGAGDDGRHYATPRPVTPWVERAQKAIEKTRGDFGVKAIATGSITTAAPLADPDGTYSQMPQYPTRIVDLLVDRRALPNETNTFSYLQQTQRTNNAAPVADAAVKPTSIYKYEEREGRVVVVAHLSEATPERFFDDTSELQRFLQTEMEYGLYSALENQIVAGTGVGENMTGLLNTSGTFVQPWSTDLPRTLRKARTTLEVVGEQPTAWAIHPGEYEAIDLLREGADGPFLRGGFDTNIAGNLPIVSSIAVPMGKAILADWRMIQLIVRQEATIDADRSGDLFRTNQVQMRVEGRYGLAVRRTTAVCKVNLAA